MYELIQSGENTYYVNCPAKAGIYRINEQEVYLIDSGSDKDAARKIHKIIEEHNWKVKAIINTHSHADHIGGNALLQQRCRCPVYTTGIEACFTRYPQLEPSFLYGGYPHKSLRNKFLMARPSCVREIEDDMMFPGLQLVRLRGHTFEMLAVRTDDDIWFLADALVSRQAIDKYHIFFLYDVAAYLQTLKWLESLNGHLFIPAHTEVLDNLDALIRLNRDKINDISDTILGLCNVKISFEDLLKAVFDHYHLKMDFNQNVLAGSTIRSYLSYLIDEGKVEGIIDQNKVYYKTMPALV